MNLPKLGSPPCIAVFIRGELIIDFPIFNAIFFEEAPLTFSSIILFTPSPSKTTLLARFNKSF